MNLIKRIDDCQEIPSGYGIAWTEERSRESIVIPVPFNFIGGWLRRLYGVMVRGPFYRRWILPTYVKRLETVHEQQLLAEKELLAKTIREHERAMKREARHCESIINDLNEQLAARRKMLDEVRVVQQQQEEEIKSLARRLVEEQNIDFHAKRCDRTRQEYVNFELGAGMFSDLSVSRGLCCDSIGKTISEELLKVVGGKA